MWPCLPVKNLMKWDVVLATAFKPFHDTFKVLPFTDLSSILYKDNDNLQYHVQDLENDKE